MSKYKREKSQIIEIEEEISILVKKSLQLEYLFIISEFFLEFIYKLHVLKMSMKPNHPLKSQLSIDWKNESKNKKNSIKTTKFKFGFEKLKKKKSWEKNPNKLCMIVILREKKNPLIFFFDSVHNDPKNYSTFSNKIKKQKQKNPPYNLLNWKTLPIKFPQI